MKQGIVYVSKESRRQSVGVEVRDVGVGGPYDDRVVLVSVLNDYERSVAHQSVA